ncbi:MAG TPA: glycosyltransferase family 1 protein [Gemmatimonadaceae bacterium]|nr:glycosyltransferase family 1 protein [Gemmatimonadaceae bacterium]
MKILIDALTAREGGGLTYLRQIVPALVRADPTHQYHVLLSPLYQSPLIDELRRIATPMPVPLDSNIVSRYLFLRRELPRRLVEESYDALFTVNEIGCTRPTRPHVVLARNYSIFAPLSLYHSPADRWRAALYRVTREPVARATLRRATHVAFVSDTYRQAVIERLKLDPGRTSVVYHGIDPAFSREDGGATAASRDQATPYFLCVSSLAPHKNYEALLHSYATARQSTDLPALWIAGASPDPRYGSSLRALADSLGVASSVRFLGRVSYEDLPALYRGSTAFVFPSRLETFGQPLLEAMSAGIPVIASRSAVSNELCGDAAVYVDPLSPTDIAQSLVRIARDERLRAELGQRGRVRAGSFSWDRTARQTLDIIDRATRFSR